MYPCSPAPSSSPITSPGRSAYSRARRESSSWKVMIVTNAKHHGFSADVRMYLYVNGQVFAIGQLGPDFMILDDPADHPPTEAEIALSIDGRVQRWHVQLPDGVRAGNPRTRIAHCREVGNGSAVG